MIKGSKAFGFVLAVSACACLSNAVQGDNGLPRSTPKRVVSFNLCADQLLLALADPEQIAGLSPYAVNAALSAASEKAKPYRRLDWDAESVINLAPDLVLAGPSDRPTRAILGAAGLRIVQIDLVTNLDDARRQAREIGVLLGHPDRGEALARDLDQAEARLRTASLSPPRTALVVQRGGYADGSSSLIASMLKAAGFRAPENAPAGLGGFVSMEQLLVDGPDVLVLQDAPREAADQGALFVAHPALHARYRDARIDLPSRYTLCGGPALVAGLNYLTKAIGSLR